jgi:hypothetical protein
MTGWDLPILRYSFVHCCALLSTRRRRGYHTVHRGRSLRSASIPPADRSILQQHEQITASSTSGQARAHGVRSLHLQFPAYSRDRR